MKRVIVAALVALALTACSNDLDTQPVGNGQCEQTTKHQVFGLTYSTSRSRVACGR